VKINHNFEGGISAGETRDKGGLNLNLNFMAGKRKLVEPVDQPVGIKKMKVNFVNSDI
jgi:hypothetical protein